MDPVPMGLNCLIGSEGQTKVWAQLRSQIDVRGRRLLETIVGETCHLCEPEPHGACHWDLAIDAANVSIKLPRLWGQCQGLAILASWKTT